MTPARRSLWNALPKHRTHSRTRSVRRNRLRELLAASGMAWLLAFAPTGCSRPYYRNTADCETNYLVDQKVAASAMPAVRRVPVDRASRMFDPFNPDRPPMPEDDPVAHRYMQRVDGKKHYPLWDVNGRTNTTESPDWWQMLPLDERGVLVLDSNTAVRLAAMHSTTYQAEWKRYSFRPWTLVPSDSCSTTSFMPDGKRNIRPTDQVDAAQGGKVGPIFRPALSVVHVGLSLGNDAFQPVPISLSA